MDTYLHEHAVDSERAGYVLCKLHPIFSWNGAWNCQFQEAGFSTVICGPGSIEQAHQPDEYVERRQMERGAAFMLRLAEMLAV